MPPRKKKETTAEAAPPTTPADIYLVVGEDNGEVDQTARRQVDRLCPVAEQSFGLEIVDGAAGKTEEAARALRATIGALQTVGFMLGGRKTVWLRNANFLYDSQTGRAKDVKAALAGLTDLVVAGLATSQALVISAPKVDKRSAFYKAVERHGHAQIFEPPKPYELEESAIARARDLFGRAKLQADENTLAAFASRTGPDSRQMTQEIDKLTSYLGDTRKVTVPDIEALVSRSRDMVVWDFPDAVADQNLPRALTIFRQLIFQGESAVGLLIQLEKRLRELLIFRECLNRQWARITGRDRFAKVEWIPSQAADTYLPRLNPDPRKMHWYPVKLKMTQAARFSGARLQRMLDLALDTHEKLVSGGDGGDILMEHMLVAMLAKPRGGAPCG